MMLEPFPIASQEPPDDHDFVDVRFGILPLSHHVTEAVGGRSFTFTITLPSHHTCDCHETPSPIPSSFMYHPMKVGYRLEVVAKKIGRFKINTEEK